MESPPAKATRRERWAWYMYDFGNSGYASIILLAIYPAYFKEAVVGGANGSRLWGIAIGIAMLTVAIIAPVLGAIADFSGAKKRFLFVFTTISCVFTASIFFVREGDWFLGMLLFILAEIGYRGSQVFYNSLLPEIADQEEIGTISGNGWAVGSVGGIIILVVVLALLQFVGGMMIIRLSMLITAVWYFGFALFIFLRLKERAQPKPLPEGETYLTVAFKQLASTFRAVKRYREFIKFIIAFLIYNDGIIMVLEFAAIIGAVLFGMTQESLIIFIIVVELTNVLGSYVFGVMADKGGSKLALMISFVLMIGAILWLYFAQTITEYFIIGAIGGMAMAGLQSVSRTMAGQFAPPGQSAEFFGFFAVAGRSSSFVGPTIFGLLVVWATNHYEAAGMSVLAAEQMGHRVSLFSVVAFLVVGMIVLLTVNEAKGREVGRVKIGTPEVEPVTK